MKTKSFKMIAGCFLLIAFFAINSFGQATKPAKEGEKTKAKVEKTKVPKEVTDTYYMEYPGALYENWYGYPTYNFGDYWYDDWYDYGPYSYVDYPEYYVVEFTKDKTPQKAIYSKTGKKVAIHKMLTDLPKAVTASISKGEYKAWKLGKDKEEIFQDKDKDQMKVYKVNVEKGKEKHTLFFQPDGKLLKDKKVA